jgi:predicted CoA-substrate-specific enzyme activase
MLRVGLDLGSSYTKGVLVDAEGGIVDAFVRRTGYDYREAAREILERLSVGRRVDAPVFTCGYGREQVDGPIEPCTEIVALTRAVHALYPRAVDVLDIGGQDMKFIRLTAAGAIDSFRLNPKCAAGTGSFVEEAALRLGVDVAAFDALARAAEEPVRIGSYCTVFAVSEMLGALKNGAPLAGVVLGIYESVVDRATSLAALQGDLVLTGGLVAHHPRLVDLFRRRVPRVDAPARSQLLAAYGCALPRAVDASPRDRDA